MPRSVLTRTPRILPALGAVLVSAVVLSACGGGGASGGGTPSGNAIVKVAGTPIDDTTLNHWVVVATAASAQGSTTKPAAPVPPDYTACVAQLRALAPKPAKGQKPPTNAALKADCASEFASLKGQAEEFLISADWLIADAKNQGITVSDASVVKGFAGVKKQSFPTTAAYNTFLRESSYTYSDLLLREKLALLYADLKSKIDKGVAPVTQAQIASYYNSHSATYNPPASRNLLILLTKTKAQAQAARSAIKGGTAFGVEAKKVSIDTTTKATGGVLNNVTRGQNEAALDRAIFSAPVGALEGPVQTSFGFYVFQVQKANPAVSTPLSKVSANIKSSLLTAAQTAAQTKYFTGLTKRWTSKTDCRPGYVVQDCKQYKAPATSATPSTGTTGG